MFIARRYRTDWRLLQQRSSNVEKPTVVSLVRQLSRLYLGEEEYFIGFQELMSRLTEGRNDGVSFKALVINGPPERCESTSTAGSSVDIYSTENPLAKLRGQKEPTIISNAHRR